MNLKKDSNVWNYKLKSKLPTKKQEEDFVKFLRPDQKQYTVVSYKEMPKLPEFKILYFSWYERILRKILKKGFYDE